MNWLELRLAACRNKLCQVDCTQELLAVRSLQAEIRIIESLQTLPERKLIELKQKEATERDAR